MPRLRSRPHALSDSQVVLALARVVAILAAAGWPARSLACLPPFPGWNSQVVHWWEHDRAASGQPLHSTGLDHARSLDRALRLIFEGHISRARLLQTSSGLGDIAEERMLAHLNAKHPHRRESMPNTLDTHSPSSRHGCLDWPSPRRARPSQQCWPFWVSQELLTGLHG